MKIFRCLIVVSLAISGFELKAETFVSGFGSITGYHSSSRAIGFNSDIASPFSSVRGEFEFADLSDLGIQVNHVFNSDWQIVGQAVARKGRGSGLDDMIKIASLNYTPNANWMVRLGRFSARNVFFSDSRYINYAQLTVYPVHSFYAPIQTNPLDGLELTYTRRVGDWLLSANGYYGYSDYVLYTRDEEIRNPLEPVVGLAFDVEYGRWHFRMAHNIAKHSGYSFEADINNLLDAFVAIPPLFSLPSWDEAQTIKTQTAIRHKNLAFTTLSVGYQHMEHLFRAEFGRADTESGLVIDYTSGYLLYSYQHDKVSPYISLSAINSNAGYHLQTQPSELTYAVLDQVLSADSKDALNQVIGALNLRMEQQGLAVGVRIDLTNTVAFKAQYEKFWIAEDGASLWKKIDANEVERQADVIAFSLDWIF